MFQRLREDIRCVYARDPAARTVFEILTTYPGVQIGRRFFIDRGMSAVIGETAEIGDHCTLYHGVTLGGISWSKGKRHPTLGARVVVGAEAKALGPIHVGDDARIGSNAVVLKDVPAEATVVGVPGHVVAPPSVKEEHANTAQKMGFDAYGTTRDMPDPVAHAINCILERLDSGWQEKDIPDMENCQITSTTAEENHHSPTTVPPK